ncbi:hypothetical protein KR51_00016680 [Rubidibacter lacunae KORDI 51-2]|uniref:Uncharacterized protein n=1 Tax=Rubidibacter lacunae KORDI 51-2 TaxID=582515 RepID=U5DB95_9CHRO|nr:DUF6492 family protein [Rubidibacter lacunae]ERN41813.1 hypothetical protein KR51_00016680 [Rubidibacter lacunae KORDI 51-2]
MTQSDAFDIAIPLFRLRWNTRAVLEGLTAHYAPRAIHVIAPAPEARALAERAGTWQVAPLFTHEEETFFVRTSGLTKEAICGELALGSGTLYTPGWYYQQLLKLGAPDGIEDLSEWYVVWDSDLLPVATWPLLSERDGAIAHTFALLQHNRWGNARIVAKWTDWIRTVLGVEPVTDPVGTFVAHHMWFKQEHLGSYKRRLGEYFQSDDSWLLLMMRSALQFETFAEYWSYSSWVADRAPTDLAFHSYEDYGETTERFFDDGTGLFSATLARYLEARSESAEDAASPSFEAIAGFVRDAYGSDPLPSSLSFESSPRHLKKGKENMHIEEQRSRWNPLNHPRGVETLSV